MNPQPATEDRLVGAPTWLAWLFIITGFTGLLGSFELSVERVNLLLEPESLLACDVSPFITCSGAMESAQGSAFGFPNPFIGLMGFVAPIAVGVALLAGAKFRRWLWTIFALGVLGALGFVLWLAWNSIFLLGIICPWCFLVWIATYTLAFPTFAHAIGEGAFGMPESVRKRFRALRPHAWVAAFVLLAAVIVTIAVRLPDLIRLMFI